MGRSGKVESTKLPGGLLGGFWFALLLLILVAAFVSFLFGLFLGDSPQTNRSELQCLYCDDFLTTPSKAFHSINIEKRSARDGLAVPLAQKATASSTANSLKVEMLTPIRFRAVGFT